MDKLLTQRRLVDPLWPGEVLTGSIVAVHTTARLSQRGDELAKDIIFDLSAVQLLVLPR